MKKIIAVFGPSGVSPGLDLYREAESLGARLAASGFNIVTGGYGGVMEAASKGAREHGGGVIGVLAEVYAARGREPNQYLSRSLQVKSAADRLMELIDLSDAAIAIGTSPGTMIEIMTLWDYTLKKFIQPRPIILVGSDWQAVGSIFDNQEYMHPHREYFSYCDTTDQALTILTSAMGLQQKLPELDVILPNNDE